MADVHHELRKKLYDLLLTNFPSEYADAWDNALQVKFENQKFVQPLDSPFIATYLMFTEGKRASVGTTKKFIRHCGFFCIECQVPQDSGMTALWKMADAAQRSLQEQQTTLDDGSYLSLYTAKVVGNTSQDNFYFVTVMVPFECDACPVA